MYKYWQRKNSNSKYAPKEDELLKNNYIKMYNLELETMNNNTITQLQNRIGNTATEELFNELSMMKLTNNKKVNLIVNKNMPYNNSTETNSMLNSNLRSISNSQTNNLNDVLSRNMLYDENKQIGRVKLKAENIHWILEKMSELCTQLKIIDSSQQDKSLEVKLADKMLNNIEKITVSDVDYILNLIKNLPSYNNDKSTIDTYMKVFNLLVNTGIDLAKFLRNNGHINIQKKMLYQALGATKACSE